MKPDNNSNKQTVENESSRNTCYKKCNEKLEQEIGQETEFVRE
jgi:hypothetical protein